MTQKAIVFLTGGVDSTTCLAIARNQGYACYALTFDYGQRHRIEIDFAKRIAKHYHVVEHRICQLDLLSTTSALTNHALALSAADSTHANTYVPARNIIFLSHALSWAEELQASVIYFGANADDSAQYPDCRPEFIEAFQAMANVAMRDVSVRIEAPLLMLNKAAIIQRGHALGVDYAQTWSCYSPIGDDQPCGTCGACRTRAAGFEEVDDAAR